MTRNKRDLCKERIRPIQTLAMAAAAADNLGDYFRHVSDISKEIEDYWHGRGVYASQQAGEEQSK